jgi:hypothetical protein
MMQIFKTIIITFIAVISLTNAQAQKATRIKHFNIEKGIALQGYDPVSYFTQNKAIKGNSLYAVNADGIVYYCSSLDNKNLFIKDFKKYEPQYGGWCSYAMGATGEKVEIDPETFKIKDGKLYLFYHTWANNTLTKWNEDEAKLKQNADKNWGVIFK